jgi:hypothetical protein
MMIELTENGKKIWINQNSIILVRDAYYIPEGATYKTEVVYGDGRVSVYVEETPQEVTAKMFTPFIPYITCDVSNNLQTNANTVGGIYA